MAAANVETPFNLGQIREIRDKSSIPLVNNVVSDEDLRKAVQKV